jgi:hypothetical protein
MPFLYLRHHIAPYFHLHPNIVCYNDVICNNDVIIFLWRLPLLKHQLLTLRRGDLSSSNLFCYFMHINVKEGNKTWLRVKWSLVTYLTAEPWKMFWPTWQFVHLGNLVKVLYGTIVLWSPFHRVLFTVFTCRYSNRIL